MARIVEFRSSEQPHMSMSESLYYRLAEPLVFRDLDGVLGDIPAACCRRCGEVTLRSDEVANHLCTTRERTERLVEKGMESFRAIVDRKDIENALTAERAARATAEQQRDAAVGALERINEYYSLSAQAYYLIYGEPTEDEPERLARAVLASAGEQPASSSQEPEFTPAERCPKCSAETSVIRAGCWCEREDCPVIAAYRQERGAREPTP